MDSDMHKVEDNISWYYTGAERRRANKPRREHDDRRYRLRDESLIGDFRLDTARRQEDVDGFIEIDGLNNSSDLSKSRLNDSH
jgi:hypothetical protein